MAGNGILHKQKDGCTCIGCTATKIGIDWSWALVWRLWHWRGMAWDPQGRPVIVLR